MDLLANLDPKSKAAITVQLSAVSQKCPLFLMTLMQHCQAGFEFLYGSMWDHIAGMLTDIPAEKLQVCQSIFCRFKD